MKFPSLGQKDPLEEDMVTNSIILAWRIPQTEEPGGLWSIGSQTGTTEATQYACILYFICAHNQYTSSSLTGILIVRIPLKCEFQMPTKKGGAEGYD